MQATPRSGQVFSRIVVPLVLFILVVGGVAWVIQYLPSNVNPRPDSSSAQKLVKFMFDHGVADANDREYLAEYEPGQEGKYDFPMENIAGQELEAGLDTVGCTCSEVKIALIPPGSADIDVSKLTWIPLKSSGKSGEKQPEVTNVLIPVEGRAIVRLGWKAKNDLGTPNLRARLWFQPRGMQQSRQHQQLSNPIRVVPPLQFLPGKLEIEPFQEKGSGHFLCWSSTRDLTSAPGDMVKHLDIDREGVDPGFEFTITPLTGDKLKEFKDELAKTKILSRPKSAVRIDVNVYEKRNNAYLDQGHFSTLVPLLLDGEKYVRGGPGVYGYIPSDVRIVPFEREGRIKLGTFDRRLGYQDKPPFEVQLDPRLTMLTVIAAPTNVNVKLHRNNEGKGRWLLTISVPPNTNHFPPVENILVLRTQPIEHYVANIVSMVGNTAADDGSLPSVANFSGVITSWGAGVRQVRIPVLGEAVSR
jgi:hypothetical protein